MADQQASTSLAAVDAVIDEVLGGDLGLPQREQLLDECAYQFIGSIRDQAGGELDPELAEGLNKMVPMSQTEKDAIMQQTNRVVRRVLRPLGYKMLQLQGLDPATADPETARAALQADLTPEQQAAVDEEAEELFKQVYLPEMNGVLEDIGVDTRNPDQVWEDFGKEVMSRQPEVPKQRSTISIAAPAAAAGALVAFAVSALFGWIRRRRQQRREQQQEEEEVEEDMMSDSYQDDESAYAEQIA